MGNAIGRPHRGGCELFTGGQSECDGERGLKDIDGDIDYGPHFCPHGYYYKSLFSNDISTNAYSVRLWGAQHTFF